MEKDKVKATGGGSQQQGTGLKPDFPVATKDEAKDTQPAPIIHGVGQTALLIAAARALETDRPDRLFSDPLATVILKGGGEKDVELMKSALSSVPMLTNGVTVRTLYIDHFLERAAREKGIEQVAILGAGMDTRAYRLDLPPKVRFFELDLPHVLDFKERILASPDANAKAKYERTLVRADLSDTKWGRLLVEAGFQPHKPTVWVLEGLIMYLEEAHVKALLDELSKLSAKGSEVMILGLMKDWHKKSAEWQRFSQEIERNWKGYASLPTMSELVNMMKYTEDQPELEKLLTDRGFKDIKSSPPEELVVEMGLGDRFSHTCMYDASLYVSGRKG